MDKFTKNELLDLILYTIKAKKLSNDDDDDDDDDFHLNFDFNKLKQKLKEKENTPEWFDIGASHSNVQSVLLPKKKFTRSEAIDYVKKHFKYKKIDENQRKNYYSFRQFNPHKDATYSSKKLNNGVILVIEYDDELGGSLPVNIIYKSIKNGYASANNKPEEFEKLEDGFEFDSKDSSSEVQVYINFKEKRIIINFVGTYKLIDWTNNYEYVRGRYRKTRRFKHAKEILEKIINLYPHYKITLIGHSQSAVICRELGKDFGDKIFEIISVNGANLRETALPNEYNIRSDIDVVSLLTKKNDRNVIIPRHGLNLLKEHSPDILKRLNPHHEIGVLN